MKLSTTLGMLPLVGALALAACQDAQPLDPFGPDAVSEEDAIALDVMTFAGGIAAAMALAEGPVAAAGRGHMGSRMRVGVSDDATLARARFQEALRLRVQDPAGAVAQAREGRRLIVRSAQAMAGGRMAVALVERLESLSDDVAQNPGAYNDDAGLYRELMGLATQARMRMNRGDTTGAAERGVLGEQRTRQRRRDGGQGTAAGGADVSVALGAAAVGLATRLLDEGGADDEQLRYLDTAQEYLRAAEAALAAGDPGRAIHYAGLAEWTALKAVVLPGGVTDDEARAMLELAGSLYAQAATVEVDETAAALLERARLFIANGTAALESGAVRGVGALWKGAVICTWILG